MLTANDYSNYLSLEIKHILKDQRKELKPAKLKKLNRLLKIDYLDCDCGWSGLYEHLVLGQCTCCGEFL